MLTVLRIALAVLISVALGAGCATVATPRFDSELKACSRSLSSPAIEASVEFANESADEATLFWVQVRSGDLTRYASVSAGQSHHQQTFFGHLWYASSRDGKVAQVHCVSSERERVVIGA